VSLLTVTLQTQTRRVVGDDVAAAAIWETA
jgi:hypothetical protein